MPDFNKKNLIQFIVINDFLNADIPNDGLALILLGIFQIFALLLIFGPPVAMIWSILERDWDFAREMLVMTVIVWLFWFFPKLMMEIAFLLFSAALVLSIITVFIYGVFVFPAIKLYEILRGSERRGEGRLLTAAAEQEQADEGEITSDEEQEALLDRLEKRFEKGAF